jgi:hypothetical protein
MTTLRSFVIVAESLVILTIGMAGAAVADSLINDAWRGVAIAISRTNGVARHSVEFGRR